jgi:hypothetical protein
MNRSYIPVEIQDRLDGNTGCIVFDCAVRNLGPFDIDFKIQMGMEILPDQIINHRYPNKRYYTLVKKTGRKLSKIGYPYFFDLTEKQSRICLFSIKINFSAKIGEMIPKDIHDDNAVIDENCEFVVTEEIKQSVQMVFPLQLNMTKEKPVCGLMLRYIPKDGTVYLESYYKDGIGYKNCLWVNKDEDTYKRRCNDFVLLHGTVDYIEDKNGMVIYGNIIEPFPSTLDELLVTP